jgi:hypothetical protein
VSLRIEAGAARHPDTGKWVDLPLPHGEKPRLVMLHLNGEALRTGSPIIDVRDSMTAFVRALGIHVHGRNIRTLRDQLARLAAAHIMLGIGSKTIKTDVIDAFDLWWPDDAKQRALWPSTVQLAPRYFDTLTKHAVPLDSRAVAALAHSALDLDVYSWLAQRLHRITKGKPQTITWSALKVQFGPDYDRLRDFRRKFVHVLREVQLAYPTARLDVTDVGLVLRNSSPPVTKRLMQLGKGMVIDVTPTPSDPVE